MKRIECNQHVTIQHALSQEGEYIIGPYSIDGIDIANKVIYEFNGCWLVESN